MHRETSVLFVCNNGGPVLSPLTHHLEQEIGQEPNHSLCIHELEKHV